MVLVEELYLFVSYFSRNRRREQRRIRMHRNLSEDQILELKEKIGLEVKDLTYKFIEVRLPQERNARLYAYQTKLRKVSKTTEFKEWSPDQLPVQDFESLKRFANLSLCFEEYQDGTTRAMGVFIIKDRLVDLMPSGFGKVYSKTTNTEVYESKNSGQSSYFAGWINYKRNAKQSPSGCVYYITANNEVAEICPSPRKLTEDSEAQFERVVYKYEEEDRLADLCVWRNPRNLCSWLYVLTSEGSIIYFDLPRLERLERCDYRQNPLSSLPAKGCCIATNETYLVVAECVTEGKTLNNYYVFRRNLAMRRSERLKFANALEVDCSNSLISTQNSVHSMQFFEIGHVLYLISCNIFAVCNLFVFSHQQLVFLKKVQVSSTDVLWTLIKRVSKPGLFIIGGSNKLAKDLQVTFDGKTHPPIYSTEQNIVGQDQDEWEGQEQNGELPDAENRA